jgi:deferrochelatase/peroxidase EfeB
MQTKSWNEMSHEEQQEELVRVQKADCLFNNQAKTPTTPYKEDPDAEFFAPPTHIL